MSPCTKVAPSDQAMTVPPAPAAVASARTTESADTIVSVEVRTSPPPW
jgi:hypothetical protein